LNVPAQVEYSKSAMYCVREESAYLNFSEILINYIFDCLIGERLLARLFLLLLFFLLPLKENGFDLIEAFFNGKCGLVRSFRSCLINVTLDTIPVLFSCLSLDDRSLDNEFYGRKS
jgi:hypothetical protein